MSKFSVILKIDLVDKDQALKSIKDNYSKSTGKQFKQNKNESQNIFKIDTSNTNKILKHTLNQIKGVTVVSVESELDNTSKLPRRFSTWLMIGLIVGWLIVSYIAFFIADNFIDILTPSQLLVIQISIAVIISIWIFLYDKKTQQEIIDVLSTLDLRTSEINENIKDLDNSN